MKKQVCIIILVLSLFLSAIPVYAADHANLNTDSTSGYTFLWSNRSHAGRTTFDFSWSTSGVPNQYLSSLGNILTTAVSAWSNAGISDDSSAPLVTIYYVEIVNNNPDIWGEAYYEQTLDSTGNHLYKSRITMYDSSFTDPYTGILRNQNHTAGILAHEIGHVYGFGDYNGVSCIMHQGILWNNPKCTTKEEKAMKLLTDQHNHNNATYSYETYNTSTHRKRCTDCLAFTYANHNNLRYSFISHTGGHTKTCGTCSQNLGTFSHTYTYQQYTSAKHKYYCMYCSSASSNYRYQDHTIIYSGGVWRCQYCSYVEGTKRIKQPEELVAS